MRCQTLYHELSMSHSGFCLQWLRENDIDVQMDYGTSYTMLKGFKPQLFLLVFGWTNKKFCHMV